MRIIVATFHCIGKYPMSMAALKGCVRYFIAVGGNSCGILHVMRPYPGARLALKSLMTACTSARLKRRGGIRVPQADDHCSKEQSMYG
jgi:hypothetical protein